MEVEERKAGTARKLGDARKAAQLLTPVVVVVWFCPRSDEGRDAWHVGHERERESEATYPGRGCV